MTVARFRIPLRIQSASNLREHWAVKAKRVKAERAATYLAFLEAWGRSVWNITEATRCGRVARVTLTRIAPRALDDHDNIRSAMKGVADELTRCLGLPNDRDPRVSWHYAQRRGGVREYGVDVEVVVEAVKPEVVNG